MTKKTHSEGKTLEEANNINKSLMVLGKFSHAFIAHEPVFLQFASIYKAIASHPWATAKRREDTYPTVTASWQNFWLTVWRGTESLWWYAFDHSHLPLGCENSILAQWCRILTISDEKCIFNIMKTSYFLLDCLRVPCKVEFHWNFEHLEIRCKGKEDSNQACNSDGELTTIFILLRNNSLFCANQDPREALIVSLRREVNALQDENEHLRNALQLSASASEPSRSRKNSAGEYIIKCTFALCHLQCHHCGILCVLRAATQKGGSRKKSDLKYTEQSHQKYWK